MVYTAPLDLADGLSFVLVGGYKHWQWQGIVGLAVLILFLLHATVTLTRKTQRSFILCLIIQLLLLTASVAAFFYYCHWDSINLHG